MLTDKKIEVSIFFSLSSEITSSFFVYSWRIYEEIWAYWLFKEVHFPGGFPHSSNCLQCRRPGFNPLAGKIPWRREWQLTPVFWPGEFHGLYSPWGHKELDTTEWLSFSFSREEESWFLVSASFPSVNTPNTVDFKLPSYITECKLGKRCIQTILAKL